MDAHTRAWMDQVDARIAEMIRRHRWAIQYVGGGCSKPGCAHADVGPPFAYTVGLFGLDHPELLIFSVSPDRAVGVLNVLGERIVDGASLLPGRPVTVTGWARRMVPEPLPNPGEIVFEANRFYARPDEHSVPVLQLSYDDAEGRFPWDEGYATPEAQPRPGTFRA